MKASVLIIEDDEDIAELISLYLKKEGIETITSELGEEGLKILESSKIDLVILDINLPGIDGYEVLQKLREFQKLPVIIVSARTNDADMILGFGYGADDFVQKPFSPSVLATRVRAHLRRASLYSIKNSQVKFGNYTLDLDSYSLKKGKSRVNLSPKEMELLIYLVKHQGKAISSEELYHRIWGNEYGDYTTVPVHIQRLRQKIEKDKSNPCYIKTVHGLGYLFQKEDSL